MAHAERHARIAMLYPHGSFSIVRGVADAARLLADAGYQVDVYYRRTPDFAPDRLTYPGISVVDDQPGVFRQGPVYYPKALRHGRDLYRRLVTSVAHRWWRRLVLLPELRRRHATRPYACVIGLDWYGLTAAGPLAQALGVPLVYWSLELLFGDDIPVGYDRDLKRAESHWSRAAAFTIIQDEWRAAAFVRENGVDPADIMLVPNAPRGKARRQSKPLLRDAFAILPSQRIAICTGFLRPWAMSLEIVRAASTWPDNLVLYVQSKVRPESDPSSYAGTVLGAAKPGRVMVGVDPVPTDEFDALIDSADIGIALYNPRFRGDGKVDRNMELMGYSSGKLADYLRCGLPVVASRLPGIQDLVERYECGVCVADADETAAALRTIESDYDRYSANACRCFDELLELERHFQPVIDRLDRMTAPAARDAGD